MNFERLATDFAGIKMKTPVMGASGTFGFGIEYKDFLNLGDVGAIISKGLTPLPRSGNNGVRVAETPGGMLNCIGLENPGIDVFLRDILPKVRQEAPDTAFIANFSAGTVEDYGMMAAKLDVDGVDGVEVNISCPNVKEGGIVFGTDPRAAAAVTEAVKKNTKKPVIVKKDILGIIGNRLQYAVLREALHILELGAAGPEEIDAAMKYGPGFRYSILGPLETVDLGGLDIFRSVSNYLFQDLGAETVSPLLNQLADQGRFGVKTGAGFYDYQPGQGEAKLRWRNDLFQKQWDLLKDE